MASNQKQNKSWCAQRIPFQHWVLYLFPTLPDPGYIFSILTVGEKGVAVYSLLDVTSQNTEGQRPKQWS